MKSLPRKRVSAGGLVFHRGRLLIVKPVYRPYWLIPGGVVEANESPLAACTREIKEELGVALVPRSLLMVDFRPDPGDGGGDSLHFIFTTDELTDELLEKLTLPSDELAEFRLLPPDEALSLLGPALAVRVRTCLPFVGSGRTICSRDGIEEWRGRT